MIIVVGYAGGYVVIYDYYEGFGVSGKLMRLSMEVGTVWFDGETLGFNLD